MDAATFATLFERHVATPARGVGFEPWGKSLWLERGELCAALLRTERHFNWPFKLTFVAGHTFLRDFEDNVPLRRSREVSEYPVKLRPSDAARAAARYRYHPHNLGRWPHEAMEEHRVEEQLAGIGRALVEATPLLVERLTPEAVLAQLERRGEGAWAEERWIADYRHRLGKPPSGGGGGTLRRVRDRAWRLARGG